MNIKREYWSKTGLRRKQTQITVSLNYYRRISEHNLPYIIPFIFYKARQFFFYAQLWLNPLTEKRELTILWKIKSIAFQLFPVCVLSAFEINKEASYLCRALNTVYLSECNPFRFSIKTRDSFALASSCAFTLKKITALVIIFLFQKLLLD